jgi:SMODS-associated and fused to various effectors sensor domain
MTDSTGKSFLSYRRTRSNEAALLIASQHDHGIPTWQDQKDLAETHTADELRRILEDRFTANALLWITPDVKDSNVIRKIEVPGIRNRIAKDDGFFLVPVCAGGIDYKGAAEAVDQQLSADNLEDWNLRKVTGDPISADEAASVARRILKRRLEAICRQLAPDSPLKITMHTRTRPAFQPGTALMLDWSQRFNGREAEPGIWQNILLPALSEVAVHIRTLGGGRSLIASGLTAIPAATALGAAFLAQAGQKIAWNQYTPGRAEQLWSLDIPREDSGFIHKTSERDLSAEDLAVLVSVTENVELAFAQTQATLPKFRAITRVSHKEQGRFDIASPGQANDLAHRVIEAVRAARSNPRPLNTVHLFMSVPVGLAMLIGQLLNTFGRVQTYEHIPTDAVGIYRPAALLFPST